MCCLFFFFKQKTAYEMRISDWSSDVCRRGRITANRKASHAVLRHRFRDRPQRGRQRHRRHAARDRHALRLQGPKCSIERKEAVLTIVADDDLKLRQMHELLSRSEEHTSELQSLMRISYAVFCL